jgi:hypothetical protein
MSGINYPPSPPATTECDAKDKVSGRNVGDYVNSAAGQRATGGGQKKA